MPAPALDIFLQAPDTFSLFGLERRYEIDPVLLEQRYQQLTEQVKAVAESDPPKAIEVLSRLAEGRRVLSSPVQRGDLLLDLNGGAADPISDGLPPGFLERLDALRHSRSAAEIQAERDRMTGLAARLFRQLGSADNRVVQRERRRQIREALNALMQLDQL